MQDRKRHDKQDKGRYTDTLLKFNACQRFKVFDNPGLVPIIYLFEFFVHYVTGPFRGSLKALGLIVCFGST